MIEIKILDPKAKIPRYATIDSAGIDLIACMEYPVDIPPSKSTLIRTGLSINMQTVPINLMATIFPRSGKGAKEGKVLGNLTGIIDKDYQGEILISIWNRNYDRYVTINPGEAIAQLVFIPIYHANFQLVEDFSSTTIRGSGGFGSTDG